MATSRPAFRYCAHAEACASKHLTSKYPSCPCLPARLTAIRSVQIAVPLSVSSNFGSLVRWPVPVQRFMVSSLPRFSGRGGGLTRRLRAPTARRSAPAGRRSGRPQAKRAACEQPAQAPTMRPTADTPPTRAAAADTDGLTETPSRPDSTEYDRERVRFARTQRIERLRRQAIAPDGEGGHTPWLRPPGRDAIQ